MKIKITAILLIVLWALVSCNKDNKILSKQSIPVPPFEVKIKLDPRAEKELKKERKLYMYLGISQAGLAKIQD